MSFVFQDIPIISNRALWMPGTLTQPGYFFPRHLTGFLRPLRTVVWMSYKLDAIAHGHDASGWRRTNMWIHVATAALLTLLASLFAPWTVAMLVGSLFLVHPLTLMGSSYVAGRSGQLSTLCQLAVILAAITDHGIAAVLIAAFSTWFVKVDMIILFPMIAALRLLR